MTQWLFNSSGEGIAFVNGDNVFDKHGKFLGQLDGTEIWNGTYVAEIIRDDRITVKTMKPAGMRGLPGLPGMPGLPGLPGLKGAVMFPAGYEDLEIDE